MRGFSGFGQKARMTKIPGAFFSEVLPDITSMAEMKVTLYCFWWMQHQDDAVYLREQDFMADPIFMAGLAHRRDDQQQALQEGLELASTRGTLIKVLLETQQQRSEAYYLINTARGQAAAEAMEQGRWQPEYDPKVALDLRVERPTIFTLYEQNIGPLTPLIADRLRDLSAEVGDARIEEAIGIAVQNNARKMAYIEAVINRQQAQPDMQSSNDNWLAGSKYEDEIET